MEPFAKLQEASPEVEYWKKELEEAKESHDHLWHQFREQELLTIYAEKWVDRLVKKRNKIIHQTCRMAFLAGFERCKIMIRVHLPTDSIGLLQAVVMDESLIAIAADSAEKFTQASRYSIKMNKITMVIL